MTKEVTWGEHAVSKEEGVEVVRQAYDWTISNDGTVFGLVAGDMGYDSTHINIPRDHIMALVEYWPEFKARERAAATAALEQAGKKMDEGFSYNAGNQVRALIPDGGNKALAVTQAEELAAKLAGVIAHATMGTMGDPDADLNDICVMITSVRNDMYAEGKLLGQKDAEDRIQELETKLAEKENNFLSVSNTLAIAKSKLDDAKAAMNQSRLALAGYVTSQSAIDMLDKTLGEFYD